MRHILAAALCSGMLSCATHPDFDPLKNMPARRLSYWSKSLERPMNEKLGPATPELLDYLKRDNAMNGWAQSPEAATATPALRADIEGALKDLPSGLKHRINSRLVGILTVKNLGGSALTEVVYNEDGKAAGAFVVLDVGALDRKANEWATWKESSPFAPGALSIEATIEKTTQNNRRNALQYILLHEFGHVLSTDLEEVVLWNYGVNTPRPLDSYRFSRISWSSGEKSFESRLSGRPPLPYYAPEKMREANDKVLPAYDWLMSSDFPTLYAAMNPYDDFAESFANYIHVKVLKRPWDIRILAASRPVRSVGPCWDEVRCERKRKALEDILGPR